MRPGGPVYFATYVPSNVPEICTIWPEAILTKEWRSSTLTLRVERKVTKGCAQGSCCGPGSWNVLYNALLNMKFSRHTKLVAFADDLAILTHGKTLSEAVAHTNSNLAMLTQ
jgi:hypothetical protein